ncbi:MAG: hypothetical protein IPF82_00010 [Blastocatellia bacterium]|nr:hypothetical protein [Blastocatellia bacterium]
MVSEKISTRVRTREGVRRYRRRYGCPSYLKHFGVGLNKLSPDRTNCRPSSVATKISQMMEILCHRERANSPMLVGEAGVGKTAVVEVSPVASSSSPARAAETESSHVVQLQMSGLVAGTMLRGMFEERIRGIINEVKGARTLYLHRRNCIRSWVPGRYVSAIVERREPRRRRLRAAKLRIIGATTMTG